MKVKLISMYKGPCIPISYDILRALNLEIGDELEVDIPMTGPPALLIHKIQRTGEEVV